MNQFRSLRKFRPGRRAWQLAAVCGVWIGVCGAVQAQPISGGVQNATLRETLNRLSELTGYNFRISEKLDVKQRHSFQWKDAELPVVLREVAGAFRCDFFSFDPDGFDVIPPSEPKGGKQMALGPYQLRISGPFVVQDDPGVVQMTLIFTGENAQDIEAIAGLDPELRVLDNFGRPMEVVASTSEVIRGRFHEHRQRLTLRLPDSSSVRIRSLSGFLSRYRRVDPVRVELPLNGAEVPEPVTKDGVEYRIISINPSDNGLGLMARIAWPEPVRVEGRGVMRTPYPHLVDESGQVHRDPRAGRLRVDDEMGHVWSQRLYFGSLEKKATKLVYDVWLKEQAERSFPLEVRSIPLPVDESVEVSAKSRPYFMEGGGSLSFRVVDPQGKAVEGEVSLGLSRKQGNAWDGVRWLSVVTGADGTVKLDSMTPGTYRIVRLFRFQPNGKPVEAKGGTVEVTVTAKKDSAIAPLQLNAATPPTP